jgi:CheY-like chemotaxis protein
LSDARPSKRIVIIDDSQAFGQLWAGMLRERYGARASVEVYGHPYDALPRIDRSIDLLVADLEVPGMDGEELIDYARRQGIPPGRIVVMSTLPAEELHQRFRLGEAIAVINKTEPEQQQAFLMILESVLEGR